MNNKCLSCYEEIKENTDKEMHDKCCKNIFDSSDIPLIQYSIDEIDKIAEEVIRSSCSVTGVQPKISLDFNINDKEKKKLTIVGLWGAYILKPPTLSYPFLPEIEDLTMRLAESFKIKTVKHSLIRLKSGELAYITKRIDRVKKNGKLVKVSMEDFCQLSERLTEDKYKSSIEKIGKIITKFSDYPLFDCILLFELVIFCFLTGNADMHLKNFSLIRSESGEIRLSDFYDLVSTKLLIPEDEEETALTINGKKKNLKKKDFNILGENLGIKQNVTDKIYKRAVDSENIFYEIIDKSYLSAKLKRDFKSLIKGKINIFK
ncbi:MAG TPA: HipA domain-containing protein [Spirochaetota bacterium]|jgi:serine/threonine-protein kinase HipA|nr:MAG: hypothetical protein BWX91_00612 [Spirochaetes bacterium ADurb.Bin133]HNZ28205.1 HipA domain-containing protein [Spirochaetota bacterium]HPY87637.1 HipA domain-containing protein [Spirochaetota bacterium]HQB61106.1 HipA domain-containing protein [Spirochaetota bacterium]